MEQVLGLDINIFRGLMTVVIMVAFLAIWAWAWSKRRHTDFEKLAAMPLEDDAPTAEYKRENI